MLVYLSRLKAFVTQISLVALYVFAGRPSITSADLDVFRLRTAELSPATLDATFMPSSLTEQFQAASAFDFQASAPVLKKGSGSTVNFNVDRENLWEGVDYSYCKEEATAWNKWYHTATMYDYGRDPANFFRKWFKVARALANCVQKKLLEAGFKKHLYGILYREGDVRQIYINESIKQWRELNLDVIPLEAATRFWDEPVSKVMEDGKSKFVEAIRPLTPLLGQKKSMFQHKVEKTQAAKRYLVRRQMPEGAAALCAESFSFSVTVALGRNRKTGEEQVVDRVSHCDKGGRIYFRKWGIRVQGKYLDPGGTANLPDLDQKEDVFQYPPGLALDKKMFAKLANEHFGKIVILNATKEPGNQFVGLDDVSAYYSLLAIRATEVGEGPPSPVPLPSGSALHSMLTETEYVDLSVQNEKLDEGGEEQYAFGYMNSNTCPTDHQHISNPSQCETAVKVLAGYNLTFVPTPTPDSSWQFWPKGCIVQGNTNKVFFNTHEYGFPAQNYSVLCAHEGDDDFRNVLRKKPTAFVAVRFLCREPIDNVEKNPEECKFPDMYSAGSFEDLAATLLGQETRIQVSQNNWWSAKAPGQRLRFEEPCRPTEWNSKLNMSWVVRAVISCGICIASLYMYITFLQG